MSSLIIAGDTSGTVALQAPAIAGSTVLTLPAVSGTLLTTTGGTATTATNLAGGSAGTIPYQSTVGTTAMLATGTSGFYLQSNGAAAAPSWTAVTIPPAAAQGFVTQFTGGNTPPTQAIDGFALI